MVSGRRGARSTEGRATPAAPSTGRPAAPAFASGAPHAAEAATLIGRPTSTNATAPAKGTEGCNAATATAPSVAATEDVPGGCPDMHAPATPSTTATPSADGAAAFRRSTTRAATDSRREGAAAGPQAPSGRDDPVAKPSSVLTATSHAKHTVAPGPSGARLQEEGASFSGTGTPEATYESASTPNRDSAPVAAATNALAFPAHASTLCNDDLDAPDFQSVDGCITWPRNAARVPWLPVIPGLRVLPVRVLPPTRKAASAASAASATR